VLSDKAKSKGVDGCGMNMSARFPGSTAELSYGDVSVSKKEHLLLGAEATGEVDGASYSFEGLSASGRRFNDDGGSVRTQRLPDFP